MPSAEYCSALRQQAITWANGDPDLCCHMASPGPNELTICRYNNDKVWVLYIHMAYNLEMLTLGMPHCFKDYTICTYILYHILDFV